MPHRPLPCRKVEDALKYLGFEKKPQTSGTNHEKWERIHNDVKAVVTVSCHRGEVRAIDVKSIIGQARVTSKEFWAAIEQC